MSLSATTPPTASLGRRIRRFMSDQPLVPLIILLVLLVVVLQILRPGIVNERWIANTVKFAIPLALLAGCQTMTMLTGGIDLSVGTVATMSAFIMATQVVNHDPAVASLIGLVPAVLIGLANGIGVGVFRVHPLIMTLGTSLIGTGCLQVYQRTVIASGAKIPAGLAWLGTGLTWGIPNALLLFVPVAALIIFTLRRTGFGRLLYAVGDNERATRLSGVVYWQVITRTLRDLQPARRCHRTALCRLDQGTLAVAGRAARAAFGRGGGDRRNVDLRRAGRLYRHDRRRAHPHRADDAAHRAADAGRRAADSLRTDRP